MVDYFRPGCMTCYIFDDFTPIFTYYLLHTLKFVIEWGHAFSCRILDKRCFLYDIYEIKLPQRMNYFQKRDYSMHILLRMTCMSINLPYY